MSSRAACTPPPFITGRPTALCAGRRPASGGVTHVCHNICVAALPGAWKIYCCDGNKELCEEEEEGIAAETIVAASAASGVFLCCCICCACSCCAGEGFSSAVCVKAYASLFDPSRWYKYFRDKLIKKAARKGAERAYDEYL